MSTDEFLIQGKIPCNLCEKVEKKTKNNAKKWSKIFIKPVKKVELNTKLVETSGFPKVVMCGLIYQITRFNHRSE